MACSGTIPLRAGGGPHVAIVANQANISQGVIGTGGQTGTKATGVIAVVQESLLNDGDYFTLNDGHGTTKSFEYDCIGDGVTAGRVAINVVGAGTADEVAIRTRNAINGDAIQISATASDNFVNLTNDNFDDEGNQAITENVGATDFQVFGMSGGTDDPDSVNYTLGIYMKKGSAPTFLIGERIASLSMSFASLDEFKVFEYSHTLNDNSETGDFFFRTRVECEGNDIGQPGSGFPNYTVPYFINPSDGIDLYAEFNSDLSVKITAKIDADDDASGYYFRLYRKEGSQPTYQPSELISTQTVKSVEGIQTLTYNDTIPDAGEWYYKARIELVGGSYTGSSVSDQNGGDYILKTPSFSGSEMTLIKDAETGVITFTITGNNISPFELDTLHVFKLYQKKDSAPTFQPSELAKTIYVRDLSSPTFSNVFTHVVPGAGTWYFKGRLEISSGSYIGGDETPTLSTDIPHITTSGVTDTPTITPRITTIPPIPSTSVPHEGIDELIYLVKPTGSPAGGITFTDERVLSTDYQRVEWKYLRRGGCGWFRLLLREDFPEADQALSEGWEIHIRIRLPGETSYTTWYRGVIRSVTYEQSGNERLCDVQGWGYIEQIQKVQVQRMYPKGWTVRDVVLDIVNRYIRPYTRVLRGDSLDPTNKNIDSSTYQLKGDLHFECNAYKALKMLAELQGGREFGVDANRLFYWKATTNNVQKVFYGNKDSIYSRSGSRTDERANQIKVEGKNFGSRELLVIRGDVTDITQKGLYEFPIELPWITHNDDAVRWADNIITDWKLKRDWRQVTWQGVDKRLESSYPLQKVNFNDSGDVTLAPKAYDINRIHYIKGGFVKRGEIKEIGRARQQGDLDQPILRAEVYLGAYPGALDDEIEAINDQVEALKGKAKQVRIPNDVTDITNRVGIIPGEIIHFGGLIYFWQNNHWEVMGSGSSSPGGSFDPVTDPFIHHLHFR